MAEKGVLNSNDRRCIYPGCKDPKRPLTPFPVGMADAIDWLKQLGLPEDYEVKRRDSVCFTHFDEYDPVARRVIALPNAIDRIVANNRVVLFKGVVVLSQEKYEELEEKAKKGNDCAALEAKIDDLEARNADLETELEAEKAKNKKLRDHAEAMLEE